MIRIGRMRERITIQNMVETANSLGEVERSYVTARTVWASVTQRNSYEQNQNQRLEMLSAYHVTIRHADDVIATTRLLWKSKTLEVTGIIEKFDSSVMEITATEVT